jgi:hypothetical protein
LPDVAINRCIGVPWQRRHPRALARGVGDDLVALKREAEIDDAGDYHQQQRDGQREFDEGGTALTPTPLL